MNKCLLRQLKPYLLSVTPQGARQLIRLFGFLETRGKVVWRLTEVLRALILLTQCNLRKQSVSESQFIRKISNIEIIVATWLEEWIALWKTFLSPAILLFLCLASTLDSNLVPERQDFTFEEIKQSLWDRYWPPQRQRCDFVAASAY